MRVAYALVHMPKHTCLQAQNTFFPSPLLVYSAFKAVSCVSSKEPSPKPLSWGSCQHRPPADSKTFSKKVTCLLAGGPISRIQLLHSAALQNCEKSLPSILCQSLSRFQRHSDFTTLLGHWIQSQASSKQLFFFLPNLLNPYAAV